MDPSPQPVSPYEAAKHFADAGDYDQALTILHEQLHQLPDYPGLPVSVIDRAQAERDIGLVYLMRGTHSASPAEIEQSLVQAGAYFTLAQENLLSIVERTNTLLDRERFAATHAAIIGAIGRTATVRMLRLGVPEDQFNKQALVDDVRSKYRAANASLARARHYSPDIFARTHLHYYELEAENCLDAARFERLFGSRLHMVGWIGKAALSTVTANFQLDRIFYNTKNLLQRMWTLRTKPTAKQSVIDYP